MIAWSYMEYEELVLKNVLLAQQKRRKNAVIINSTKQITILNKLKLYNVQMTLYIKIFYKGGT